MSDSQFQGPEFFYPLFKPQIINLLGWEQPNYYHCIQVSQNLCGYVQMGRIIRYLCKAVRIFLLTCTLLLMAFHFISFQTLPFMEST